MPLVYKNNILYIIYRHANNTKRVDAEVYLISAHFNRQDYTEYGTTVSLAHFIQIRLANFLRTAT